jgi:hypothetical protein
MSGSLKKGHPGFIITRSLRVKILGCADGTAQEEFYMASWDEVKGFLLSNYSPSKDEGGVVAMELKFNDGRSQLVYVRKVTKGDEIWADIVSPVGTIAPNQLDAAMAFLEEKMVCGGLVKIKDTHAVRHSAPIADLSSAEIAGPISALASAADTLEEQLVGGDSN